MRDLRKIIPNINLKKVKLERLHCTIYFFNGRIFQVLYSGFCSERTAIKRAAKLIIGVL